MLNEHDSFCDLKYTSTRRQGACALLQSHDWQLPIRVFRSSQLKGRFSPPARKGRKTSYRYDGLYTVTEVFGQDGLCTYTIPKSNDAYHTFYLKRNPDIKENETSDNFSLNKLGTSELLTKIHIDKISSDSTKEIIQLMTQDTSGQQMRIINDKKVLRVNTFNPIKKSGTIEKRFKNNHCDLIMDDESRCEAVFAGINDEAFGKIYFTKYSNIKMIQDEAYNVGAKTFPKLICKYIHTKKENDRKIEPGTKLTIQVANFFYFATFLRYVTSKNGKQDKCLINYDGSRKKSKRKIKISMIHKVHFGWFVEKKFKISQPSK